MEASSRSGSERDGRQQTPQDWYDEYTDSSEVDASADAAHTAEASADPTDSIGWLRDLELTWNGATRTGDQRPAWSQDEWLQSLSDEFEARVETEIAGSTATTDTAGPGEWWRVLPDEDAAFEANQVPAFQPAETGDWTRSITGGRPSVAAPSPEPVTALVGADASAPNRSRRWVGAVAAAAVLLAGIAIAVVALFARSGDGKPNPTTATTVGGTPTSALATTSSSGLPAGPRSFTVGPVCGRRQCTLGVRDGPGKTARRISDLHTGQVVQIDCYTHGEQIQDGDSGQQSDLWYRYTGTKNFSSALYLQGPPVPSC